MTQPYNGHRHGEAEYNSYTTITSGAIPDLATRPDGGDHFARMVHVVSNSDPSAPDPITIKTLGHYETDTAYVLDGTTASDVSVAVTELTVVRLNSFDGDNWIKITTAGDAAVEGEGMLLAYGADLTMILNSGDRISTIGGKINVIPVTL